MQTKQLESKKVSLNWKTLIFTLHKLLIVNDVDNINDGGCGYFAYFVANELERLGIEYKIKVTDQIWLGGKPIKRKVESINRYLETKLPPNKKLVSFTHCWIEIKHNGAVYKFDGETSNLYPDWNYEAEADFSGYFTKRELKVALRFAQWNKLYKKGFNQKLRAVIREAFQKNIS